MRVCVALLSLATAAALFAADKPKSQPPAPSAEEKAAMEMMAKAAAVGPEHKKLEIMAGTWSTTVTTWMAPGGPPNVTRGTSTNTFVLGGRFLRETFEGSVLGHPFHGLGYTGYDNIKKRYVSSWIDDISTGIMLTSGSADGASWKFTGTMEDPISGKDSPIEEKITVVDKDHHTFEMWSPGPDRKMFKMMEIKYARKKG